MNMKKIVATASALSLTAAIAVGGTLAYLNKSTGPVTNTFTYDPDKQNISLTLDEHVYNPETDALTEDTTQSNNNYVIVPGDSDPKDPTLHLNKDGQTTECWLYAEVVNGLGENVTLNIGSNWTATELTGKHGGTVYSYNTAETTGDFELFNTVTYSDELNETTAAALDGETITVYGYAISTVAGGTAADAWAAGAAELQ